MTPVPDPAYFDTAFGVRFGMTLCYDIKFHTPAQALAVSNLGIHDIVFSTHWENEEGPPMGLSVALFQAWSRGTGANLLAANAGMGLMHTGSGIFSRGEALATSWRPGSPHDEVPHRLGLGLGALATSWAAGLTTTRYHNPEHLWKPELSQPPSTGYNGMSIAGTPHHQSASASCYHPQLRRGEAW